MKAGYLFFLLLLAYSLHGQSQRKWDSAYYRFAIGNAQTAKPFGKLSSLVYKEFHPAVEAGYGKSITRQHHQWLAELNLNYLFHRWVQHNLAISLNGGYRYMLGSSWGARGKLGTGLQLSMPTAKVFAISDNGLKEEGHVLRPQFVASITIGADRKLDAQGSMLFLEYMQKVQAPFIREYVPLLPYNCLMLGVSLPIK